MAGTGRAALITGGTRGIGRLVSERLAASGVLLAAAYARDAAAASTLRERCAESGAEVSLHQADLSAPDVCGRQASYITGAVLTVAGGMSMGG
jgi:NAD(P)-dependent dehydrogenase (short-subunit alcohol dehydrogenase family)